MQKILMVCLGNICRSPLAEGILRDKTKKLGIPVFIDSAGTSADYHLGAPPDKRTQKNALEHGIDLSNLRARMFTSEDFNNFDIIFVMDNSNYSNVINLAKNENDVKKVELILNRVKPNSNMPVPDPYFGGEEGFQNVFDLLENACETIAQSLKS